MRVEIIKRHEIQAVGPQGPSTRVFSIGDIVDLPDLHARMMLAKGVAAMPSTKIAPKVEPNKPKSRARKSVKE